MRRALYVAAWRSGALDLHLPAPRLDPHQVDQAVHRQPLGAEVRLDVVRAAAGALGREERVLLLLLRDRPRGGDGEHEQREREGLHAA